MYEFDESDDAKARASFMHTLGGWDGVPFRPLGMVGSTPVVEVDELPPETVTA